VVPNHLKEVSKAVYPSWQIGVLCFSDFFVSSAVSKNVMMDAAVPRLQELLLQFIMGASITGVAYFLYRWYTTRMRFRRLKAMGLVSSILFPGSYA
jgi:hypothetical protein